MYQQRWKDIAVNDIDRASIRTTIDTLALADSLLDGVTVPDVDQIPPWVAAHVWIYRAMCLLLDSLDGVEEVTFSDEEQVPVSLTRQPYMHLARRHKALSDRYLERARDAEG